MGEGGEKCRLDSVCIAGRVRISERRKDQLMRLNVTTNAALLSVAPMMDWIDAEKYIFNQLVPEVSRVL